MYVSGFNGPLELYIRKSPSGTIQRLTHNPSNDFDPALSRDTTRVAFASNRDGDVEIYNMRADGTNALRLTNSPGPDHSPTWSPNGKVILFVREVAGVNLLMRMNADGTNQSMLIPDEGSQPCYSRNGTKIAFISNRTGNDEVWVCDANGGNQVQLTFTAGNESNPSWNATGGEICYSYGSGPDTAIYRMNSDGSNPRLFFDTPNRADSGPLWGADGKFIVLYTESTPGARDGQVEVIEVDGKGKDSLTSGAGGNSQPAVK